MHDHPLLPPNRDDHLLDEFLAEHKIDRTQAPLDLLTNVARAFARLPFENLTKIIKKAEAGRMQEARRTPREVLADHWQMGAGGTCFALTSTLLYLVRGLGWQAEPILADRRYGADTHSALVVWIDGKLHLLDPGYLIVQPLALPSDGEVRVRTSFNELVLTAKDGDAKVDLVTLQGKQSTYRLTYKAKPVDAGEFLRAWDVSFEADMMRYPVLSRVAGEQQIYLQKQHLLVRGGTEARRVEVPPDRVVAAIAEQFGLAPHLVAKALAVLHRKGNRMADMPLTPEPVKYFVALLWADEGSLSDVQKAMTALSGDIDFAGPDRLFDRTNYYEAEMGPNLHRRLVSFEALRSPEELTVAKRACIAIEGAYAIEGRRRVNVDIGYLDHNKIVLASVKAAGQKIYLCDGVYADLIARYEQGRYQPFAWTFPDFSDGRYDGELAVLRAKYPRQMKGRRQRKAGEPN